VVPPFYEVVNEIIVGRQAILNNQEIGEVG